MDILNGPLKVQHHRETIPVYARWFGSWRISVDRRAFTPRGLRHSYDQAAPLWSRLLDRLSVPKAYERLLQRALPEDLATANERRLNVLDCGIGTGALSIALARVYRAQLMLSGIDLSPFTSHARACKAQS